MFEPITLIAANPILKSTGSTCWSRFALMLWYITFLLLLPLDCLSLLAASNDQPIHPMRSHSFHIRLVLLYPLYGAHHRQRLFWDASHPAPISLITIKWDFCGSDDRFFIGICMEHCDYVPSIPSNPGPFIYSFWPRLLSIQPQCLCVLL